MKIFGFHFYSAKAWRAIETAHKKSFMDGNREAVAAAEARLQREFSKREESARERENARCVAILAMLSDSVDRVMEADKRPAGKVRQAASREVQTITRRTLDSAAQLLKESLNAK